MNKLQFSVISGEDAPYRQIGVVTLPASVSLVCLDVTQLRKLRDQLSAWRRQPALSLLWLEMSQSELTGLPETGISLSPAKLALLYDIARQLQQFAKPIISWIDDQACAETLSLLLYANFTIVTGNATGYWPEAGQGRIPHLGTRWLLQPSPDSLRRLLLLSGIRFDAGDALAFRIADGFLPDSQKLHFQRALSRLNWTQGQSNLTRIRQLLQALQEQHRAQQPKGALQVHRRTIQSLMNTSRLLEAVDAIASLPGDSAWQREATDRLERTDPVLLQLIWQLLDNRGVFHLPACLEQDETVVRRWLDYQATDRMTGDSLEADGKTAGSRGYANVEALLSRMLH